jgi:hypothetical protein
MGKKNIRRRSGRPLWSESGSFCADCDKFAFPDESVAIEKLEALKAQRNIRKQAGVHLLHIYPCPLGHGWHVGHDSVLSGTDPR